MGIFTETNYPALTESFAAACMEADRAHAAEREHKQHDDANGARAEASAARSSDRTLVNSSAKSRSTWAEPDWSLLDDRRGQLPEFPLDVLTPNWQDLLRVMARGAGVRTDHVIIPLLGVASSLIGIARRVRAVASWAEPISLWTALIGSSGDRKTPGMRVTLRALDLIEKNNAGAVSKARLAHETRIQKSKEATKRWKEERQAALEAKREPPAMPDGASDPGDFIAPRLYVNDPTVERLGELITARPRGMLLVRDELSGLFANMSRYSGGNDRAFWLEAHNGGRQIVERRSRSIAIDYLLIGVAGGFQPDKIARAFSGDEDGMSGRFLYGWPSTPEYHPLSNEARDVEPELQSVLTALIRLPAEDPNGLFTPKDIGLCPGALDRFEEYRRHVDATKRALDGREQQWLVKSEMQVLRLAGVLTYLEWAIALGTPSGSGIEMITAAMEPKEIDERSMVSATRLIIEYFNPHARAALRQIGLSDRNRDARRVLRWIKVGEKTEVSREDIRRDALGRKFDATQTEELLGSLVKAGWLRPIIPERSSQGGRPARRWQVNPVLMPETPQTPET